MFCQLKPRILCIDDEPVVGELLRVALEATGDFLVRCETDARKAMANMQMFKPDLVIIDINMPGLNGLAIARQLREEPWLRHRPIIFYSGVIDAEAAALRAGGEGPTEFLQKGVAMSVVEETIRRLVAERLQLFAIFKGIGGGEVRGSQQGATASVAQ